MHSVSSAYKQRQPWRLTSRWLRCRFFRVGSMVLLCHDISDIMMEAAKLCKYCGLETASTALFVTFMVTWLLARLTYYPFWIIRSTLCVPWALDPEPQL